MNRPMSRSQAAANFEERMMRQFEGYMYNSFNYGSQFPWKLLKKKFLLPRQIDGNKVDQLLKDFVEIRPKFGIHVHGKMKNAVVFINSPEQFYVKSRMLNEQDAKGMTKHDKIMMVCSRN